MYNEAEKISYQQISLYSNHPAVKVPGRLGVAYLNLGNNQLFQYKFNDACASLNKAYSFFVKNGGNYNIVKETEVYIRFYMGELYLAEKLLNEIISFGKISNNPTQLSKRNFLLANVYFLLRNNKRAHFLLQETKEIEKDKEGFNLGLRILSIINQLETEKLDIVDLNIESLRKHIERTTKMKAIRKRDVIILKLLAKLSRNAFNFKRIWKSDQKYFDLLASNDPEYRWEMKSPEMIIFHKWFESKATGKEYDYILRPPQFKEIV
jgi:tetratricopeptide (TPR) repeat protein